MFLALVCLFLLVLVHAGCLWWDACASNHTCGHFFPFSAHTICAYPPSPCLPHEGRRTVACPVSEFLCQWRSSAGHCEGGVSSGSGLLLKLHSDPVWMGLESSPQEKPIGLSTLPHCFCSCCADLQCDGPSSSRGWMVGYHRISEVQESSCVVTPGAICQMGCSLQVAFSKTLW